MRWMQDRARSSNDRVLTVRELHLAMRRRQEDERAFQALSDSSTHYAVTDAFRCLTKTGHHGSGGLDRDPVDALADARMALAAVRHWCRTREGGGRGR